MKRGKTIVEVHEDIVVDVLLRLPVKSLLRFQSACKAWGKRLHDKWFVSEYQKIHDSYGCLIFQYLRGTYGCRIVDLERGKSCRNPDAEEEVVISHGAASSCGCGRRPISLVGSSNGLVCLEEEGCRRRRRRIMLWNPATRYIRTTRKPPEPLYGIKGFGYDAKTDDYKAVWLRFKFNSVGDPKSLDGVMIYSLRSDSWKKVLGCNSFNIRAQVWTPFNFNVFVEVVCHWLNHIHVLSFDTRRETLMITNLPKAVTSQVSKQVDLIRPSFQGSLAIITYPRCFLLLHSSFDIWVLREVGSEDSWIRVRQFELLPGIERPLGLCRGEKLFVQCSRTEEWATYDRDNYVTKFEKVGVCLNISRCKQLLCFSPNLAPIGGRPEHEHGFIRTRKNIDPTLEKKHDMDSRSVERQDISSRSAEKQRRSSRSVKRTRF